MVYALLQAIAQMTAEVESEEPGRQLHVEFMRLDLASLQSTKDFVAVFKEKNLPLNILVNNAGIAWVPYCKLIVPWFFHCFVCLL